MPGNFLIRPCLMVALFSPVAALAADTPEGHAPDPIEGTVIAAGYLRYHPDLKHRIEGMRAIDDGAPKRAISEFRHAAR